MSYEPPVKIYETMGEMVEKIREDGERQILAEIKRHVDVDKEELIKAMKYDRDQYNKGYQDATIDSRRTAEWICENGIYHCSHCGEEGKYESNFCPRCGAFMKEKGDITWVT